jgi:O-antigen/teichoic acid export membrane protein
MGPQTDRMTGVTTNDAPPRAPESLRQHSTWKPLRDMWSLAASGLVAPAIGLLLSPLIARALTPTGRGIYSAVTMPILVLGIVGTFGLQDALAQTLARRLISQPNATYVLRRIALPLFFVAGGVAYILGAYIFRGDASGHRVYDIVLASLTVQIAFNITIGIATGLSDFSAIRAFRIVPTVIRAVVVIVLLCTSSLTPTTAAAALLLSPAPSLVWYLARLHRRRDPAVGTGAVPDGVPWRALRRLSWGCFPGVIATMSTTRLDQVIGLPLIGAKQLGLYAVAVSISEIGLIVCTAGRPMILALDFSEQTHRQRYRSILSLGLLATICLNAGIALATCLWLPAVFGHSFTGAIAPTVILAGAAIVYAYAVLGSASLICHGDTKGQSIALIGGAATNIAALYAFRHHGAVGAAWASVVGYGVASAVVLLRSRRLVAIPLHHQPKHRTNG